MLERAVSVSFVSEIWEVSEKKEHVFEIEKLLEMHGLKYISTSRPSNKKGGGVFNTEIRCNNPWQPGCSLGLIKI